MGPRWGSSAGDIAISRRGFLGRATALAGGLAAWRVVGGHGLGLLSAAEEFPNPLRLPTVLTGDHITLTAAEAEVPILPGALTRVWAFNGEVPGPTIRRPAGALTRVYVHHQLATVEDSLTIHLHGGHTAARFDGQPEREVIPPGGSFTYEYELMEDGAPERGALQWYHDHSHFRTGRNVWMGLAGMFVIADDAADEALGLPTGAYDLPLMVVERIFDPANQLVYPFGTGDQRPPLGEGAPPLADAVGRTPLVNGTARPHLDVEPRPYRFRILNASNFRPYNLAVPGLGPIIHVGTEAGLLPAAIETDTVYIGPAERAEIVVDLSAHAGQRLRLASVPRAEDQMLTSTPPFITDLLELRVDGAPSPVPAPAPGGPLRPLPAWAAAAQADPTPDRVWAFGLGVDDAGRSAWTINGRPFDHTRVDARPELGAIETWMLVNTSPTGTSHYIHIHDVDWLVLSRNGEPPAPGEAGLKETFRLDPGEVVVVAARFTDHLGTFMIHCHMLEHEDHGMMTTYEVVPPGEGDLPANAVPGVTSAPDEVLTLVAGRPAAVSLHQIDPQDRTRVRQVLAAQAQRPGRPTPATHTQTELPSVPIICEVAP